MAYTLKDRVLVTSTSTGTGDFSLGSAVTGYQAFTVVGNGAQIPYTIQGLNPDGSLTGEWEVGIGTWYSAGNYITRDTVLESSNSGSKVPFASGDKNVFLDLPSELVVQGPDSATASDFVAFDGTTGKVIKDSGFSSASFATAAQGAKADTAVQQAVVGQPNGVASLDSGGQVPLSQIPPLGDLNYQGAWNASTNTPTLTSSVGTKGYYYVVNVSGSTNLNGITDWVVGDWAVFNGSIWQKIDNTDAVTSVNGQTGAVSITLSGLGAGTIATQNANAVAITGGTIDGTTIGATTPAVVTGSTINANTKVVSPDYYAQSILGGNLRTSGGTSLLNWDGGGSGNVTVNGGLLANPSNKNISLAPTGSGSVTVNPATVGAMDNMVIGATTPKAITGTTVTATSFVGSGASLTNVVNSLAASTGISVSGSTGAVTVTNTAPDQVVSLTGAGTTTVTGTYPSFTITSNDSYTGTVTSVSGTGTVNGITLTGTVTTSGSLTLGGTLSGIGNSQLTNSSVTVNGTTIALGASGTITAATPNALSAGTGLGYTTGTTFDGSAARTLNLANTAVSAGSYTYASITVDAQGRLTSASSGTAPITSVSGTANQITASTVAGATTLSTPSTFIAPGSVQSTTGLISGAGIVENSATIAANYTIGSGNNAMSAGPITINSGITVTVPTGSNWVII